MTRLTAEGSSGGCSSEPGSAWSSPTGRVATALATAVLAVGSVSSCGSEEPAAADATRSAAAADSFIAWARGASDEVPWAESAAYTIGGVPVAEIDHGNGLPAALSSCLPGATEVESHACPVSPLTTLTKADGTPETTETLPEHVGCNVYVKPSIAPGFRAVVIRPPESHRNCVDDFAVTLTLNTAGEVTAVDLALSGP
jgi:hypothetical protein